MKAKRTAGLFRKGTRVRTRDAGAARWSRPVEKREGVGTVQDHYREITGVRSAPYLVRFPDGTTAWYDQEEVEIA